MPPRERTGSAQHAREARAAAPPKDLLEEKGLPENREAEMFCLGGVLRDAAQWEVVSEALTDEDFSIQAHRIIYRAMRELHEKGEEINRVTLCNLLMVRGELAAMPEGAGISYVASLDERMPDFGSVQSFARLVKEKANLRRLIFAAQAQINRALIGEESSSQIAAAAVEAAQAIEGTEARASGRTPKDIVESFSGGIVEFLDPSMRRKGLPTGFTRLDEMLGGGLQVGEMAILAARPSMGKSSLACNIVTHLCLNPNQRRRVGFFALESNAPTLLTRMMCAEARVDNHRFRSGYLNAEERRRLQVALGELMDCGLFLFDDLFSLPKIEKAIRHGVKEQGWQMVVLDHLHLLGSRGKIENRTLEISAMTRELKLLCEEMGVVFLILCQLSRTNERRPGDKKPILSDLRDGGSIEENADTVMFIHRDEVYAPQKEELKGLADLLVRKQRNGPIGDVPLRFISGYTQFANRAQDMYDEQPSGHGSEGEN